MSQLQEILIRDARMEDAETLLAWRNNPETRSMFVTQGEVSREDHFTWLRETLQREDRMLVVGSLSDATLVGVVRFHLDRGQRTANVSINLNPAMRGRRLSSKLLEAAIAALRLRAGAFGQGFILEAQVRRENTASLRCFRKVGFTEARNDESFYYLGASLL